MLQIAISSKSLAQVWGATGVWQYTLCNTFVLQEVIIESTATTLDII